MNFKNSAANSSNIKSSNEAINSSMSNSSNEAMASKEVKSTKRAHKVEPIYSVMSKARTQFKKQVVKDTTTKILCIEKNISRCYEDAARFWLDLNKEAEDLMDSRRFTKFCEDNGMVARNVAEHIIFEGKSAKKRVLNGDFSHDLDNISLFDAPLYVAPEKAEKVA